MSRPTIDAQPCGTYAGYQTHRRRHTKPCAACLKAYREYLAEWRRRNPDKAARHSATNRARDRAHLALVKSHPEEFERLYAAELRKLAEGAS